MALTDANIGHGSTVEFVTSLFVADIININGLDDVRPEHDTTHMASGTVEGGDGHIQAHGESIPGVLRPGPVVLSTILVPSPAIPVPVNAAPETINITYPIPDGLTNGAVASGKGYVTGTPETIEVDGVMTQEITIARTGVWTKAVAT